LRPQDEELAAFGPDVDLPIGQHGRRLLHGSQILSPQLAARRDVERAHPRSVFDLVHAITVEHRRRESELHAFDGPLRLLDVASLRSVNRRNHPERRRVEILIAVRHDHGAVLDHDARVDRALGRDEAPDLFARLRLDRLESAVAVAADEQTQAVDRCDDRRRIRRVVRAAAGRRDVDDVARPLVERDESQRPVPERAPVGHGRVDDHQIAVDER